MEASRPQRAHRRTENNVHGGVEAREGLGVTKPISDRLRLFPGSANGLPPLNHGLQRDSSWTGIVGKKDAFTAEESGFRCAHPEKARGNQQ